MSLSEPMFKAGETVEGYRVHTALGEGAASHIYLVQDPKTKQVWALKHVHRGDAKDARFLDQAIQEYQIASKLNHPNIRKITRLIKKTRRLLYLTDVMLVMEVVDGVSMDRRPPKRFDDAVSLFEQTARAMGHMHERGFAHADMKPNNIMVCQSANGPMAKIIDLGQSCTLGTVKGRIQGTPDYIAPEQVHRRPITSRTDVYNLGATMYWTVTGRHVPTALPRGDSLVSRIDDHLIPKPRAASEINPRIPGKLNELIMHCVEIDPEDRPDDMGHVVEVLQNVLGELRLSGIATRDKTKEGSSVGGLILNDATNHEGARLNEGSAPGTLRATSDTSGPVPPLA